jgi:hypothetical protein
MFFSAVNGTEISSKPEKIARLFLSATREGRLANARQLTHRRRHDGTERFFTDHHKNSEVLDHESRKTSESPT